MSYGNQRKVEPPLRNTVRIVAGEGGGDLQPCPEGQQALGLIKIKNIIIDKGYGPKDGFRFVFRSREHLEFVCVETTDAVNSNSHLYKLIDGMSGGKLTKEVAADSDHFFNFMQRFIDGWYLGTVKHRQWQAPDGTAVTFTEVANRALMPHPEAGKWGKASEFFKTGTPVKAISPAAQQMGLNPVPAPIEADTGFEDYPDKGAATAIVNSGPLPRYIYRPKLATERAARDQQLSFIESKKGVHNELSPGDYHFPDKVPQLEKYYVGEIPPQAEKEDVFGDGDDLPWGD